MSFNRTKLLFSVVILSTYLMVGVLGLFALAHMSEMPMANCPYAFDSFSLCQNNLDHINNWHQFSNFVFPDLSVLVFLTLGIILYFINTKDLFNSLIKSFFQWKYYLDNRVSSFYRRIVAKWLSLFENSPSFLYTRHN